MNLKDVIDENFGLVVNDFKDLGKVFGDKRQLTVVGWSSKYGRNSTKYYIVKCSICEKDPELFGEGYFRITNSNINSKKTPCGCAKIPKWSKEQFSIICSRRALTRGLNFLGFCGEWAGNKTKLRLSCPEHGEWTTTVINSFLTGNVGCNVCNGGVRKEDSEMRESFLRTGGFHKDAIFERSEKVNYLNYRIFWKVYCPDCLTWAETTTASLQCGWRPCRCCSFNHKQFYINLVKQEGSVIGLKFGISRLSSLRLHQLNENCKKYDMVQYKNFNFETKDQCRAAETQCKRELDCGTLPKESFGGGWTETTSVENIDSIIDIVTRFGGVEVT